jgi:CDP-diacylglycerol--glycerol-3-phosphate 3-phosphatidyltransferase
MRLNWANRITILRILLIVPFVSCMLKINDPELASEVRGVMRYAAVAIFLVMSGSDVLDGYLARRRGQTTKLGTFLDPTADKLLITCACLLLASARAGVDGFLLPPTVVVVIIGKDILLLTGFLIIYFITERIHIAPARVGKTATGLQLSMVAAILLAPEFSAVLPGWIWFLRLLWWSAAAMAVATTLVYIRQGSRYLEQAE